MLKGSMRLIVIAAVLILGHPSVAQDSAQVPVFDGIWETDWGRMALWQANDAIWGVFGSRGEIGGHIDGDKRFQFYWDDDPDDFGTGWIELDEEGDRFEGMWYSDLDISEHGRFEGEYLWANTFEIGDRSALEYEPGEAAPSDSSEPPQEAAPGQTPEPEVAPPGEASIEPEFAGDTASAWSGTWETGRGFLVLAAMDGEAIGTFGENGVLDGSLEGATLTACWTVTEDDETSRTGDAIFWLAEDGVSFRGTYNDLQEPDVWRVWSGTKVPESSSVVAPQPEEEETEAQEAETPGRNEDTETSEQSQ